MAAVPTKSTVFKLRVPTDEMERWRRWNTDPASLSAFVRRMVNEGVDALEAAAREGAPERQERIEEIRKAFPDAVVTAVQVEGKKSYKPDWK